MNRFALPRDIGFSRAGALLSVRVAQDEDGKVSLNIGRPLNRYTLDGENEKGRFWTMMSLDPQPMEDCGKCEIVVGPACMTLSWQNGASLGVCFPEPDCLRVRGERTGIRLRGSLNEHEAVVDRLDGTYQLCYFDSLGEILFVPLTGTAENKSRWVWTRAGSDALRFAVSPDEQGICDLCIHYADANAERRDDYPSFDECVRKVNAGFSAWQDKLRPVSDAYRDLADTAKWLCWSRISGGMGQLRSPVLMAGDGGSLTAAGCAAFSMICRDPEEAVKWMMTPFAWQSENGQLPYVTDDKYVEYRYASVPIQGLLLRRLCRMGVSPGTYITDKDYHALAAWLEWWHTARNAPDPGVPCVYAPEECGFPSGSGTAVRHALVSSALLAWLILFEKEMEHLAEEKGFSRDGAKWREMYRKEESFLMNVLWRGSAFRDHDCVSKTFVSVPCPAAGYVPLLLGNDLDRRIGGALSESLKEDLSRFGEDLPMAALCLSAAGENDAAERAVALWLENHTDLFTEGHVDTADAFRYLLLASEKA